jgi:hypothetical protein
MAVAYLRQVSMPTMMEIALPFRDSQYIYVLCETLLGKGIAAPADLLLFSIADLESKLSKDDNVSLMQMLDAIRLRKYIDDVVKKAPPTPSQAPPPTATTCSGGRWWKHDERLRSRGRSWSPPLQLDDITLLHGVCAAGDGDEKRDAAGVQDTSLGASSTRPPLMSAKSRRLLVAKAKAKSSVSGVRGSRAVPSTDAPKDSCFFARASPAVL